MSTKLVRAALALLCAVAVLFGTALFPGALGVELGSDSPLDGQASELSTPDGTSPERSDAASAPTETGGRTAADATPTTEPTPTATSTPTDTETEADAASDSGGSRLVSAVLGLLLIGGFGLVAFAFIQVAGSDEDLSSADGSLLPLVGRLVNTVVATVAAGAVGRTVGRIPQLTTAALLSGSAALARFGSGISTVSGGVLTGLTTGLGSLGTMSLRGAASLPSALGSLTVAPFQALGGLGGGGFFASLRSGVETPSLFGSSESDQAHAATAGTAKAADDGPNFDALSVQEAWALLTERVPMSNPATATPGEYARRAIDSGLPAEPVRRLTNLFREVEYGGKSSSTDRTESAREAIRQLLGGGER